MFNNFKFKKKKVNIVEIFFRQYLPLASFLSSILGFGIIWFYLRSIDRLDFFMQMNFSAYGIISITLFFLLLFFYFFLPFFMIEIIRFIKPKIQLVNFTDLNVKERVRFFYSISQPTLILLILVPLLMCEINNYDDCSKYLIICFSLALIILLRIYYVLSFDVGCSNFKEFSFISLMFSLAFIIPFKVFYEVSESDCSFFVLVFIYLLSLFLSNYIISLSGLKKYKFYIYIAYFIILIFILFHSHGFKFQRMMLRPIGITQTASQSGWYLLKNEDFLELIENNKFEKSVKTINERTYTYINGYLILNVGNVRVICPHDFESKDDKKSDTNRLDFSRCLNLTSEDIKFMKRGLPNNDKRLDDNKKADVSKETENSKKN